MGITIDDSMSRLRLRGSSCRSAFAFVRVNKRLLEKLSLLGTKAAFLPDVADARQPTVNVTINGPFSAK
ncbi:hypothetical protein WN48_07250 [Eufriesea mexicana]|uniref:Uncharacterized protein n=1 Tax=Eufriesea mexicana TaxID=516756 RepID=A0A310SRK3_9HYME|nr:hypothetical protein WN48_07250 [Eufriesea mexicana]